MGYLPLSPFPCWELTPQKPTTTKNFMFNLKFYQAENFYFLLFLLFSSDNYLRIDLSFTKFLCKILLYQTHSQKEQDVNSLGF